MMTVTLSCNELDRFVDAGQMTPAEYGHACRLQLQVRDAGGTVRDQNLALIHELPDLGIDPGVHFGEAFDSRDIEEIRTCIPDFLRHGEMDLEARTSGLASARTPIRIIWLLDMIDTFTHDLVRLDGMPGTPDVPAGFAHTLSFGSDLARRRAMIRTRCTSAYQATDICAMIPRFIPFVVGARQSILEFLVRFEARLG